MSKSFSVGWLGGPPGSPCTWTRQAAQTELAKNQLFLSSQVGSKCDKVVSIV